MKSKFFLCGVCGNIVGLIKNGGGVLTCCNQQMENIIPGTVDAAVEKHVPVVSCDGDTVTVNVGEQPHPMTAEHLIEWVFLSTEKGGQRKELKAGDDPKVCFELVEGDKPVAVYAYCNLHGIWVAEI